MTATVTPRELQAELSGENPPKLLDVREDHELEIAKLDHDLHIPMSEFGERISEIAKDANWVVICRSGQRSGMVAQYLQAEGYHVRNLEGGLLAWARSVDPNMRTY